MRLPTIVSVFFLLCVMPAQGKAQQTAASLLAKADTLVHSMQYEVVGKIADSLLQTSLNDSDRSRALLLQAHVLTDVNELESAITFALNARDLAETTGQVEVEAGTHIALALLYELTGNPDRCSYHLDQAEELLFTFQYEWLYAHYFIRRASFIKVTNNEGDSVESIKKLIFKAEKYAKQFHQLWHLGDTYLLLSTNKLTPDHAEQFPYAMAGVQVYKEAGHFNLVGNMYQAAVRSSAMINEMDLAWSYLDSCEANYLRSGGIPRSFYEFKAYMFKLSGQHDSAFETLIKARRDFEKEVHENKLVEVSNLAAVHENEKKQIQLEAQARENAEQQKTLNRTIALLVAVLGFVVLLMFSYRRQRAQNKKIKEQQVELEQSLRQQKVLLAEVQHRVKNNLQVIIAMLDLQTEAHEGKGIEEITRENQRRIESMAFLHDKVYLSDDLEKVKLQAYLVEIAELLRETNSGKGIQLEIEVNSEIATVPMRKAIPLGLITVELLMNSFKHAFEGKEHGKITITTRSSKTGNYASEFVYQDNGKGYTKTPHRKGGLGVEIINGFVGQLHGKVEMDGSDGFNATIQF